MSDQLSYEVIVTDKRGEVIQRLSGASRSYLKAYSQMVIMRLSTVNQTITDTGGTGRNINTGFYTLWIKAAAGAADHGTRVGTSNQAVAIDDYALVGPIAPGTGAGQLSHLAETISSPSVSASESTFTVTRVFPNGSGGSIIAREIGTYCRARSGITYYYFCIVRDVLASPVTIPDGGAITVIYTFRAVA